MRATGRGDTTTRWWVGVATWVIVFAAALSVDAPVSQAVQRWSPLHSPDRPATDARTVRSESAAVGGARQGAPKWVKHVLRAPGHFAFTLCLATLLVFRHPLRWRAGAFLLSCTALGGIGVWLLKWVVGRTRPFHGVAPFELRPVERGIPGLITNHNLGFPSGDATLAFATAACMGILVPRSRPIFFIAAVVVGVERVLENAHYVSDVVAAAGLGMLCVPLARWLWQLAAGSDAAGVLSPMLSPAGKADDAAPAPAAPVRTPGRIRGGSRAGASA